MVLSVYKEEHMYVYGKDIRHACTHVRSGDVLKCVGECVVLHSDTQGGETIKSAALAFSLQRSCNTHVLLWVYRSLWITFCKT